MLRLLAVAGLTDVLGERRIHELSDVWLHAGGNVLVVLLELYNFTAAIRTGLRRSLPTGLIVVAILLFTGWKGWNMVYRHRVGVRNDGEPL